MREILNLQDYEPFCTIGERGLRTSAQYKAVCADPFLFSYRSGLHLFYESKTDFGVGEIWAQSMDATGKWSDHGLILKEPYHLSFPQVFLHRGEVYMLPESASSGKLWLYRCLTFPTAWEKQKTVLDEALVDTVFHETSAGVFLLGTTRNYELKAYFARSLDDSFAPVDLLITNDRRVARSAGPLLLLDNCLYRPSQDCSTQYGESVGLNQLDCISPNEYREHVAVSRLIATRPAWMALGHHHISTVEYNGRIFVAVDGIKADKYANTITLGVFKTLEMAKAGW